MTAPIYRNVKGQALTSAEGDENIRGMYEHDDGIIVPKAKTIGVLIDPSDPAFGWHDLLGELHYDYGSPTAPDYVTYTGNIKERQYAVNDEGFIKFHIPHDYASGTNIYIHVHWSHNSLGVTTGAPTFIVEGTYAKGHDQDVFGVPVSVSLSEPASVTRYQHMITEMLFSAAGGAGGLIATEDIETDGLLLLRLVLSANTMDGGALPFVHYIDIHYQSTGLPTKNKAPDFWT